MTREGTSAIIANRFNASVKWSILGAFWGAFQKRSLRREGLYRAFGVRVTFYCIRLHVFNAYLVSISLDSISILLFFYYDHYS